MTASDGGSVSAGECSTVQCHIVTHSITQSWANEMAMLDGWEGIIERVSRVVVGREGWCCSESCLAGD